MNEVKYCKGELCNRKRSCKLFVGNYPDVADKLQQDDTIHIMIGTECTSNWYIHFIEKRKHEPVQ